MNLQHCTTSSRVWDAHLRRRERPYPVVELCVNSRSRLLITALTTSVAVLPFRAAPLHAQAPVSRDLAAAYARTIVVADSESTVDFVEGRVASQVEPYVHVPANVHVLGTVVVGRSSYVLGTSSLAPDSVVRAIGAAYRAEHWDILSSATAIVVGPANGILPVPAAGGFRSAPSTTAAIYCRDSTEARATAVHDGSSTTFRIFVTRGGNNPCTRLPVRPQATAAARPVSPDQLVLPTLVNPANANQDIQCFNIGMRSQTSNAQLLTTTELPTLLDHYGKQLEGQGWAPTLIEAPMLRKIWTRRDSSGKTQTATLVVSVPPQAQMCRDASLTISIPTR